MRRLFQFRYLFTIATLVIAILFTSYSKDTVNTENDLYNLRIKDYIPKNNLLKVFNGGFENLGSISIVKNADVDEYVIYNINSATGDISVYRAIDDFIKLIYFKGEVEVFDKNYSSKDNNKDTIVLKSPIKKGTSWKDINDTQYEITGINKKINTPSGDYNTLELTLEKKGYEIKKYYAKGLGVVKTVTKDLEFEDLQIVESLIKVKSINPDIQLNNADIRF